MLDKVSKGKTIWLSNIHLVAVHTDSTLYCAHYSSPAAVQRSLVL